MKLLVGLGNPEDKYKNTFHNLGFMCADIIAEKLGVTFNKEKCRAMVAETNIGGQKVIIAKPLTYMNLSGESVRELVNFYKIDTKDLLVFFDDYDLIKGTVRIREKGSAGTHNGMRNIVSLLGKTDFPRVRIGFKPTEDLKIPLINYVLSGIKEEDKESYIKALNIASSAGYDFACGKPIQEIMQRYNTKSE
ncbi:MAG: aminoacyl-tRNA hydrolase [Clostridiales bacterium]|nr:aminoacyl-tRNA hydrolase [Clostridiales bacterium]